MGSTVNPILIAGGQGVNTGIGDIFKGKAKLDILKSYEPERLAFTQRD